MGSILKDIKSGVDHALTSLYGEGKDKIASAKKRVDEFLAKAPQIIELQIEELKLKLQIAKEDLAKTQEQYGVSEARKDLAKLEVKKAQQVLAQKVDACIEGAYAAYVAAAEANDVTLLINLTTLISELQNGDYEDKHCVQDAVRALEAAEGRLEHLENPHNYELETRENEVAILEARLKAAQATYDSLTSKSSPA